jgi:hypothetical protein
MSSLVGAENAACLKARCGRCELEKSSYSRSKIIRCRWFQTSARSNSSRRQLPIQRSITEFIRGAWTALG